MAAARQDGRCVADSMADRPMEVRRNQMSCGLTLTPGCAWVELPIERLALQFAERVDSVAAALPRYRWYLADQTRRAVCSVYLNLREGLGEFRPHEKARILRIGIRSARETDGCLILALTFHSDLAEEVGNARAVGDILVPQMVRLARYHGGR